MSWNKLPAACAKGVKFAYNNSFANWLRYMSWHYGWDGRQFGLHFHDQCFEPAPEVQEALRRLNLKEPWRFDQRVARITRAHMLSMNNERLPKSEWVKWDEETFYLKPYLDEVEAEKLERDRSSGLKPSYILKLQHQNEQGH